MDLGTSHAFSSDDKAAIEKSIESNEIVKISESESDAYFETTETANWIKQNDFKKVALQFPDNLLHYAQKISLTLEALINVKPYILADTSYGSCCVDEVAAQHVNADCIVHYGETCMSKVFGRTPVRYVLPKEKIDFDDFASKLNKWKFTNSHTNTNSRLTFIVDVNYFHLKTKIVEVLTNLFGDDVQISFDASFTNVYDENSCLFYVGRSTSCVRLTLIMMMNPFCRVFSYDPTSKLVQLETSDVNKMLKKRLFLIEKAKDAQIVGIVAGTLSIANYLSTLERLKSLCKNAGKTYYILSVGKLNVAKLSNFAEVDVFVLLSCPYNLIFDQSDYYRPIVSPFEFDVACSSNPSTSWMAGVGWTPDSSSILNAPADNQQVRSSEKDDTDLSLVTGKLRNLIVEENMETVENALIKRSDAMQVQLVSAESYLRNRSWKGLEEKLGETPVGEIKEGRSGIAMSYENELAQ